MSTKYVGVFAIFIWLVAYPAATLAQGRSALADVPHVPLTVAEMQGVEGRLAPVVTIVGGAIAGAVGEYAATGQVTWAGVLGGAVSGAGGLVGAALFGVNTLGGASMTVLYMADGAALGALLGNGIDETLDDIEAAAGDGAVGTGMSVSMTGFDRFGGDDGVDVSCLVFGCFGQTGGATLSQARVNHYVSSGFTRVLGMATYSITEASNCASCGVRHLLR